MNILYILSGTTLQGGATKSFLTMLEAARNAGHNVAVVAPDNKEVTPFLRESGVNVEVIPYRFAAWPLLVSTKDKLMFLPRLVRDFFLNRKARRRITDFARRFKADLIHDNTSVTDGGQFAASHLGIPHVTHIREYGDKDFNLHIFNIRKRLNAPANHNVAITRDIARYRRIDGSANCDVIYNGIIDTDSIHISSDKQPFFLYAGRIQEGKGIADLIEAYIAYSSSVSNPLPLKVAGGCASPALMDSLTVRIKDAGADRKVEFLGALSDVAPLMSKAAAVIIPSLFEGFGRVMPEAMASGALCVGRDTGGTHEQFENGLLLKKREIGLRFSTTTELTKILAEIDARYKAGDAFSDDSEYSRMILDAADTVKTLYTKEVYGKKILNLYERISEKG